MNILNGNGCVSYLETQVCPSESCLLNTQAFSGPVKAAAACAAGTHIASPSTKANAATLAPERVAEVREESIEAVHWSRLSVSIVVYESEKVYR